MEKTVQYNAVQAKAQAALEIAKAVEVTDIASAEKSKAVALELKDIGEAVEAVRVKLVKPLNDEVKAINAYAKEIAEPIEGAKKTLTQKLKAWQTAEREKAEAEQAAARAKAEAEAAALMASDEASIEEVEKAAEKVEVLAAPVTMARAEKPVTVRNIWKFIVKDESKIPREYLMPDTVKIGKAVRGGLRVLDGVEIYSEESDSI